ncbi:MAG: S1 RNA-binding domain-containing protein [Candidatus Daviesbacteria bacterium]|nr:MAG: S1 RNA-binding domain-containing protein [Candidatus Daviesbacteria bacterium]
MEDLLSSVKPIFFSRGQEITGQIMVKTDREAVLDLNGKSDGIISSRDFSSEAFAKLKVGDVVSGFVVGENDSGQIQLSTSPKSAPARRSRGGGSISWDHFIQAKNQQTPLNAKVIEVNKGGLMLEVAGVRGFLPSSLIGYHLIHQVDQNGLSGKETTVLVSEIDEDSNRLIFTQKDLLGEDIKQILDKISMQKEITAKVLTVLPFAAVVEMEKGVNGVVFSSEASWEGTNLATLLTAGQEVKAKIISIDKDLGRVSLSVKQLQKNPFDEVAEKLQPDDVVKAMVTQINDQGVNFELKDPSSELGTGGIVGFMENSKKEAGVSYEVGQSVQVLVDSVDKRRQRVNLAPFITTTKGLIYK